MAQGDPISSERSPLLGSNHGTATKGHGDAPAKATSTSPGRTDHGVDEPEAGLSRQTSIDPDRAAQFSGNVEVQKQLKFIVPAVSVGVFLAAADQTIIVSSYGRIGSDLNALNLTSWIATAYMLSLTSFQPLYGKLSDIFGRKACLLFAYVVFGLGGLCCGLSQTMGQLVAARVFQGIGGGGMTTVVSIMFSDIVALQDRGLWQGVINIIYAAGAACGAPLGGFCADVVGWRWTFLAQVPLSLVALVTVALTLHLPKQDDQRWREKLRRVDFIGAAVLVAAVFALIFGMDRGSNVSWKMPAAYGSLAASAALFAAFFLVELRVAKEPFAPGHVVFPRSMFAGYACYFCSFGAWISLMYYLPLYFQAVDGASATGSALRLLPGILASVCGSLCAGLLMRRTGKYYWLTVAGYALLALGVVPVVLCSGVLTSADSLAGVVVGTVLTAFGNGIGVTSVLIALIATADPADQAVATACTYLFRSLGSTVGVSLCATVIQQVLRSTLRRDLGSRRDAEEIERHVRQSLEYLEKLDPQTQRTVRHAYALAIRHSYVLIFVIACGATLSSFFLREKRLSG